MPENRMITQIDAAAAAGAVSTALRRIDERLADHGERVAFIACALCEEGKLPLDKRTVFLLGLFHDIGARSAEEIGRMLEFETHDVWKHSVCGYLFIKHMTPLQEQAEAILYHHTPWYELKRTVTDQRDYAALLHLADRIDIAVGYSSDRSRLESLMRNSVDSFSEDYVEILRECYRKKRMFEQLSDGSFRKKNLERYADFFASAEGLTLLEQIVAAADTASALGSRRSCREPFPGKEDRDTLEAAGLKQRRVIQQYEDILDEYLKISDWMKKIKG